MVLLGRGLAGHGDRSVQEGGEVGRSVQLHLAQGELVRTKDALHTGVHVVLFVNKACFKRFIIFGGIYACTCKVTYVSNICTTYVYTIYLSMYNYT